MRVEVAIVGGGPAGLAAALVLGRCRRSVVVFDDGTYRNRDAQRVRGFLTHDRDAKTPGELLALARHDVEPYPTVRFVAETVIEVRRTAVGFLVRTRSGEQLECRALLLATGFRDRLPTVAGARELHGELVAPCPYCDAWDVRDQPLAAMSHPDARGAAFARVLAQWSQDIVLCGETRPELGEGQQARLAERGIRVEHRALRSVERDGTGIRLVFAEGDSLWRRMLFYHLGGGPASDLAERIGVDIDERGSTIVDRRGQSSIPGLFVAGDATRDVLQAMVAAGEGSAAGVAINELLCEQE